MLDIFFFKFISASKHFASHVVCDKWIVDAKHSNSIAGKIRVETFLDEFEIYNYVLNTVTFSTILLLRQKALKLNIKTCIGSGKKPQEIEKEAIIQFSMNGHKSA